MRDRIKARLLLVAALLLAPGAAPAWQAADLFAPCDGDCAIALYAGPYVEDAMSDVLVTNPSPPTDWSYASDDRLVATALSRRIPLGWPRLAVEPEIGIGRRFGRQDATEVWGALFLRYRGFPWDGIVVTTAAVSTGLNWSDSVTEVERDRARDAQGSAWMHFFSPEITFAAPGRPNVELLFRFHHRSGVFGLVSDAWGGAQYGTVGLRFLF